MGLCIIRISINKWASDKSSKKKKIQIKTSHKKESSLKGGQKYQNRVTSNNKI